MPASPLRTGKKPRKRNLYRRNSVRKQLTYSGKKRSPPKKASYRVQSRKGQNLSARFEQILQ